MIDMRSLSLCVSFQLIIFTSANADVISDYCKERQILADYRNEGEVKCPIGDGSLINEKDVWSLHILNRGIEIRHKYAAHRGQDYTRIQIINDINELFVMGDEGPWIKETERLEYSLTKGL